MSKGESQVTLFGQLVAGTAVLGLCAIVHVGTIAVGAKWLLNVANFLDRHLQRLKFVLLITCGFAFIVFSHTIQVWIWALAFLVLGTFSTAEEATYFSIVTYTTLGYGDMTLGTDVRIFGALCAVCGLVTFGLSTAFLVGLVTRVMPQISETES
jgi:hypothetical protein